MSQGWRYVGCNVCAKCADDDSYRSKAHLKALYWRKIEDEKEEKGNMKRSWPEEYVHEDPIG
eukprot:6141225-Lingulodinium_polyedra.AAC.1